MKSDECVVQKNASTIHLTGMWSTLLRCANNGLNQRNKMHVPTIRLYSSNMYSVWKYCFNMASARTKNLPDVKLCHTLSTIQAKNYVIIQVIGYLKLLVYIVNCPQFILNKHKMHSSLRELSRWCDDDNDDNCLREKDLILPNLSPRNYKFYRTLHVLFPEWDNVRLI